MSGEEIILKAEATRGLKVKVGDRVRQGEHVGRAEGEAVTSPVTGVVKRITFEAERHEFVIVIKSD